MTTHRIFTGVLFALALFAGLLASRATTSGAPARVGDPAHPETLPGALTQAYREGSRDLIIEPGLYVLPDTGRNTIELTGWKDAAIHAPGVTLIFNDAEHRPVLLNGCENVLLEGATLQFAGLSFTQGRVKEVGQDAKGRFVDWQIDAGYPTAIDPAKSTYDTVDGQTRLLKPGTGDSGAREAEVLGPGRFRLRGLNGLLGATAAGDWLVTRARGGTSLVQLRDCRQCTMRQLTLKHAGFAAFFETNGEGGHRYLDCRIALGPKPPGASEEPLVSCGADGFHSVGLRTGPTLERCLWEGVLLDDCIAIHGSFRKLVRVDENKLILEASNRSGFAPGDAVRVSSPSGFFGEAVCTAYRILEGPLKEAELTLDRPLAVPGEAKVGNPSRCGKGYRILDCTLGNTRSRGILVKADDGAIKGCTIEGCGMTAISIGPEYAWDEADYGTNVLIAGNTLRRNGLNGRGTGGIWVHGEGALGNRKIVLQNNQFLDNAGLCTISIEHADEVKIEGNRVTLPGAATGGVMNFTNAHHVRCQGNTIANVPDSVSLFEIR